MSLYRCFVVDLAGKISAAAVVEGADDSEAARAGARLFAQHPAARTIEIWLRERRTSVLTRSEEAA